MSPSLPLRLAPSILAADFTRLGEQVREVELAGADWLHIDVMDGRFVPNISFGTPIVEACGRVSQLPLDVHLMIVEPDPYLEAFAAAGASGLTVHAETCPHLHRTLQQIRELGLRPGLALNPLTPLEVVREALPYLDLVLVMTVEPGFGGQSFIEGSLGRLEQVAGWRDERNPACEIQVDGGIDPSVAARVVRAGANILVAGSAIFASGSIGANLARLRDIAALGRQPATASDPGAEA